MKIELIQVGKTDKKYLIEGIELYTKRLKHYIKFEILTIADLKKTKNLSKQEIKEKEGNLILAKIQNSDSLILLDDKGKAFSSENFSVFFEKKMIFGVKKLIFVIGGAYGFSEKVYQRANMKLSLSKMTFSHQMVRLIFVEQVYRAFTILKGEPYHHS